MAWLIDGVKVSEDEFVAAIRRHPDARVRRPVQLGDLPPHGPERVHSPELLRKVARRFDAAMVLELGRTEGACA